MKYLVYTLREECTNNIFYIGITQRRLQTRLSGHLSGPANDGCADEIKRILSGGGSIVIEQVQQTENTHDEYYWIDQFRGMGFNLLNRKYDDFYLRQYITMVESIVSLDTDRVVTTEKVKTLDGLIVQVVRQHLIAS